MYSRCQAFTKSEFLKINPRFYWSILSIFGLLIWSCQQETQKVVNTTHAEIYIRYLADKKELSAESTFYTKGDKGNTIINFDNVTFDNHPLKGKNLGTNHTRYRIGFENHTLAPKYEIRFWNKKQTPKSIPINLAKVDSFSFSKIIKKGEGATLKIEGKSLSANEKISFIFTNEKNETAELKLDNISIDKPITLSKEQLSILPVGKNEVYLIRTEVFDKKTEETNTKGVLQFFSQVAEVEVVE